MAYPVRHEWTLEDVRPDLTSVHDVEKTFLCSRCGTYLKVFRSDTVESYFVRAVASASSAGRT